MLLNLVIVFLFSATSLVVFFFVINNRAKSVALANLRAEIDSQIRKEFARDFHDQIGNKLSTIINYTALLRSNIRLQKNADIHAKLEDAAKSLLTNSYDLIWSIDTTSNEVNNLFLHIKDFGEKYFEDKAIAFYTHKDVSDNLILPMGYSREINLICKEALTNAFKHANATCVKFSAIQSNGKIKFIVQDNGVGFDVSSLPRVNGINNIKYRAAKVKGLLNIKSTSAGTQISLEFESIKQM